MKWSWKLFDAAGINVFVHWTFLLLPAVILLSTLMTGGGLATAIGSVTFVLAIFACVLLHEFGHALMAQRFGIATHDITLLPIGGVARLERMPEKPQQEFAIALAGPAVNVVIAISLLAGMFLSGGASALVPTGLTAGSFVTRLLWANVALVVFNMLPAFPMDGGRVLRALLAMRISHGRATEIAAGVGQGMAVLFGIVGFFSNWMLMLVAIFVYMAARSEAEQSRMKRASDGLRVGDVMSNRVGIVPAEAQVQNVVDRLLRLR